jgi:hypothetical protein
MTRNVIPSKSPNLPSGPVEYDQRFQDQFANALRLYFTRVDGNTAELIQTTNNISVQQWLDGGCY